MEERIQNEIAHGRKIAGEGEAVWNWSSPAGQVRWKRRCDMFRALIPSRSARILEIGCGTGLFTREILAASDHVTAIDISQDLLNLAKTRAGSAGVNLVRTNAYRSCFIDSSFDIVLGSSVLHHLDIDQALPEFFRIMKAGGKMVFTEPNMLNPQIAIQKNIPFVKRQLGDSPDETAFFRWRLAEKLRRHGFTDIQIRPFDFVHPAIPAPVLSLVVKPLNFLEKIPLAREIAGSLFISAGRP